MPILLFDNASKKSLPHTGETPSKPKNKGFLILNFMYLIKFSLSSIYFDFNTPLCCPWLKAKKTLYGKLL